MKHEVTHLLKDKKLKVTTARIAILEAFSTDCGPQSAESLVLALAGKAINVVTIYRTLTSLETAGVLSRVDLRHDSIHYELAKHHHHHIVCTRCGVIEGFDLCRIDQFAQDVLKSSKHFTQVQQHSLELFGLCNACT